MEIVKNGEEKKTSYGPYSRFFGPDNTHWTKDSEWNSMFLKSQERYFNDLLRIRGHVFLNEVYDSLGYPRTIEGQIVGWIYEEGKEIKFAMFDGIISFNVDGIIIYSI